MELGSKGVLEGCEYLEGMEGWRDGWEKLKGGTVETA